MHTEKIYNYCAKSLAAKAMVSTVCLKYSFKIYKKVVWLRCYAFLARDSIYAIARYMSSSVCLSVPLSVTRVDQSDI